LVRVSLTCARWNQVAGWLGQLDNLHAARAGFFGKICGGSPPRAQSLIVRPNCQDHQMASIDSLALNGTDWERVAPDPVGFAGERNLAVGADPNLLRVVGQQTVSLFKRTGVTTHPGVGISLWTAFVPR